jgi:hypothetical protein
MMSSPSYPRLPIQEGTRFWADRRKRTFTGVGAVAIAIACLVVVVWLRGPDQESVAIRSLPEHERRALYDRTLGTLESSCSPSRRRKGLDDFCRTQAEFVVKFPECDARCASLAAKFRSTPTR